MELRNNELFKRIIAILLIVVMTMAQFALVGTNAISYAIDMIATNSGNVEFCAYFVNAEGEKINSIDSDINAENLKLKIEIAVKNEGYFNGKVTLGKTSFKFKEEVNSKYVSKIENNIIYLNQINADTTAIFDVGIEYINSDKIDVASLNQTSEINLTGSYENSVKPVEIIGKSEVTVIWKSPDMAKQKLDVKVLTNSKYNVEETKEDIATEDITEENVTTTENSEAAETVNKRIVQFMVGSKIDENIYPVKNTKIELEIPGEAEEVLVHKRTTNSTNGDDEFGTSNYVYDETTKKLTINVQNNQDAEGYIDWIKNSQDLFVITCKYPESTDLTNTEIVVNGEITTYDEKKLRETATVTIQEEKDGIITNSIAHQENEIYKGKIYIGETKEYETNTIINIDYIDAIQSIEIKENKPIFTTQESKEKETNIKYSKTTIDKNTFLALFGESGYITLKDQDGNIVANITKDSQADENGKIVIQYNTQVTELNMTTSNPVLEGILTINHTKQILDKGYSRKDINNFIGLKESIESKYISGNAKENKNTSEQIISLKETQTEAHLSLQTESLIANGEQQIVKIQVILESYKESQDVYKNPTVKITFPSEIQVEAFVAKLLYNNEDELEAKKENMTLTNENGDYVLTIKLEGEQIKYLTKTEKGYTLEVSVMTKVNKNISSNNEKIILNYTNENAISYINNAEDEAYIQILEQSEQEDEIEKEPGQAENEKEDISEQGEFTQNIIAQVGNEIIQARDEVKAGEIIDYTITLQNSTKEDITALTLKANIPDGTTYIEYSKPKYDEEAGITTYDAYIENKELKEKIFSDISVAAGKTIILNYSIKVNEQITDRSKIVTTIQTNNNTLDVSKQIEHTLKNADIVATLARGKVGEVEIMKVGRQYQYILSVKNISSEDKENVNVTINTNELMDVIKIDDEFGSIETLTNTTFNIQKLLSGQEQQFYVWIEVNQTTSQENIATISAWVKDKEVTYRTNEVKREVEMFSGSIELNSNIESTVTLKSKDEIIYIINVENTGEQSIEELEIRNTLITEYLELQSITLNGKEYEYTKLTSEINEIEYTDYIIVKTLEENEKIEIRINAKVKENIQIEDTKEILNIAKIIDGDTTIEEKEIKHYLEPSASEEPGSGDTGNEDDNSGNEEDNTGTGDNDNEYNNGYTISGTIWLDEDENGTKKSSEEILSDIEVKLININTNQVAQDLNGVEITAKTDNTGKYILSNIPEGKYIVIFEYDTKKYIVTKYQTEGIDSNINSDGINKKVQINQQEKYVAATDTINLNSNLENIDLGLILAKTFDLELNKYVSKIIISNNQGVSTYSFDDEDLAKVEIAAKYLSGSNVLIEYNIRITNNGEIAGYAKNIVDYLPSNLTFNSALNSGWYQSDEYIYNSTLENVKIEPGETKELKLTLNKIMTETNTGLINNKAEIEEDYNSFGISDVDSIPGNQIKGEDDLGSADVIIGIKTGSAMMYMSLIMSISLIIFIGAYVINKKILLNKL